MFKVTRRLRSGKKANKQKNVQKNAEDHQPGSVSDVSSVSQISSIRGILKVTSEHDGSNSVVSLATHSRGSRTNDSGTTVESLPATPAGAAGRKLSEERSRRVDFTSVHVREYVRTLGDNPSCSSGAPVTIGWAHSEERKIHIDDYESAKKPSRPLPELALTRQEREELLLKWGSSFHDIIEAIRTNVRVKHQRRRTVNAIGTYDRWEEYIEKAGRKIKRTLKLQKQPSLDSKIFGASTSPRPPTAAVQSSPIPSTPPRQGSNTQATAPTDTDNARIPVRPPPSVTGSDPSHSSSPRMEVAVRAKVSLPPVDNNDGGNERKEEQPEAAFNMPLVGDGNSFSSAPVREVDIADENSMADASDFGGSMDSSCFDHDACMSMATKDFLTEVENYEPPDTHQFSSHPQPIYNGLDPHSNINSVYSNSNSNGTQSTIELDDLQRDQSFWELEGNDGPGIRRKISPVVIYEDAPIMPMHRNNRHHDEILDPQVEAYDRQQRQIHEQQQLHFQQIHFQQEFLQQQAQQQPQLIHSQNNLGGAPQPFLLQPPPGSNDMVARWH